MTIDSCLLYCLFVEKMLSISLPFVCASLLSLILHEVGHFVASTLAGWRFNYLRIGFGGAKRDNKGKIVFFASPGFFKFDGRFASTPPELKSTNQNDFAMILLSGPLMSLAYCIVSILLFFFAGSYLTSMFWIFSALSSLVIFLWTYVPQKNGELYSDGARYRRIRKKGKAADTEMALLNIAFVVQNGNDYSQLNNQDLNLLMNDDNQYYKKLGQFFMVKKQLAT